MEIDNIVAQSNFSMLEGKVNHQLLNAIKTMGFVKPTPIQALTLPHLLSRKDLIGAAKTGSGKTLAFLIPAIDRLIKLGFTNKHGTGCIILCPTRELALQTFDILTKILIDLPLTHLLVVGGKKKMKEEKILLTGVNIIVSTPGRLLDHLENTKTFNCKNLKCLVVDEADKLLDAGFEKHINGIIKLLPKTRQTVLFSATIDDQVQNLARLALRSNPVIIAIKGANQSTVTGLQQGYYICPVERRISWLFKILKRTKKQKVMVFFSSCKSVDFHYEFFRNHCRASVINIHGKQSQSRRNEAYQQFNEAQNGALFCTDVAARGLDIPGVDWIVQYDPPTDSKEYIHRVGRTARGLNNTGNAVLLLRPEEEGFVTYLKEERVNLDKYNFEETNNNLQIMFENLIQNNGVMKTLARKAFLSHLRSYKAHPLKEMFNIKTLDLSLAAKAFGFVDPPHVDFLSLKKKRATSSKKKPVIQTK